MCEHFLQFHQQSVIFSLEIGFRIHQVLCTPISLAITFKIFRIVYWMDGQMWIISFGDGNLVIVIFQGSVHRSFSIQWRTNGGLSSVIPSLVTMSSLSSAFSLRFVDSSSKRFWFVNESFLRLQVIKAFNITVEFGICRSGRRSGGNLSR